MAKPVVGIIANSYLVNDEYPAQASGDINTSAVAQAAGCLPLVIPADPTNIDIADLLEVCDGFMFTGGRPNVHPSEYGHHETEAHGPFDRDRDALTLPLIRAAVAKAVPVLGVCRGFQELAVAFGSTLHPEIRDLPGRMNHRMPPDGTLEEKFALRHPVYLREDSEMAHLFGSDSVMVNSLHGQGIIDAGPQIDVQGYAEDSTAEAIIVRDAPGFALGVQWHPEWNAANDPVSRLLFEAFGEACAQYKRRAVAA